MSQTTESQLCLCCGMLGSRICRRESRRLGWGDSLKVLAHLERRPRLGLLSISAAIDTETFAPEAEASDETMKAILDSFCNSEHGLNFQGGRLKRYSNVSSIRQLCM